MMNFLLDTDICSAHMRRPAQLAHRFIQYGGQLSLASVNLAELYAGAYKHSHATRLLTLISELLQELEVIDFDAACARKFGEVRGTLLQQGISVPTTDLMIASTALVHNLTLVTHNTADYQHIPGLRLDDWLTT
jgi:tRNA(fMet)-specific endonuclease VapC